LAQGDLGLYRVTFNHPSAMNVHDVESDMLMEV